MHWNKWRARSSLGGSQGLGLAEEPESPVTWACQGPQLPGSPASPQAALTHTPAPYSFPPPHPTHCPDFTGAFVPALRPAVGLPLCREEKGPIVLPACCDTAAPKDFQKCSACQTPVGGRGDSLGAAVIPLLFPRIEVLPGI